MLNGVTISGKVRFCAMVRGTPTWSIDRLGSGVITARAEKSTRFPIKLPLTRPSLLFSLCFTDLRGRPDFCMAYTESGKRKSDSHCYLTHSCHNPYAKNNSKIYIVCEINKQYVLQWQCAARLSITPLHIQDQCPIIKNSEKIRPPMTISQTILWIKKKNV